MKKINQMSFYLLMAIALSSCGGEEQLEFRASTSDFAFVVKEKKASPDNTPEFYNLTLEVSRKDQQDLVGAMKESYAEAEIINYLSYRLKDDIKLKSGVDTVPVVLYHFERSFDLKKSRIFNLTFEHLGRSFAQGDALIVNSPLFDSQVQIPLVKKS